MNYIYLVVTWYLNTIKKFLYQKKKCTVFIVLASIILQALQLASFIVPLKMLFVLTNKKTFVYTIGSFVVDTKMELAGIMTLVVALLLLCMIVLEKVTYNLRYKCSQDIWKNSKKLHIYHNQEQIATNIYTQVTNGLSASLFIVLILFALVYIYALIPVVLLSYWIVAFVSVVWLVNKNRNFQKNIETDLQKVMTSVSLFGFLIIFITIIADFLSAHPSSTIAHAVIALILVRHLSGSVSQFIMNIRNLFRQKVQMENIFFKEHPVLLTHHTKEDFLGLFYDENYQSWVVDALKDTLEYEFECVDYEWYDLGVPNVICLVVTLQTSSQEYEKFFIKVYNKNLQAQAVNDATLYAACNLSVLSPYFMGASVVDSFHCHIFTFKGCTNIIEQEFQEKRLDVLEKIYSFEPSKEIVQQYRTTHQLIYERFTLDKLYDIGIMQTDENYKELLEWFKDNADDIMQNLSKLPLRMVVPNITLNAMMKDESGEPKLLNFMNWKLEPFGFGFVSIPDRNFLKEILNEQEYRFALIVSNLQVCEQNYNLNKLHEVMKHLKTIRKVYESSAEDVYHKGEDKFVLLMEDMNDEKFITNILHKSIKGDLKYIKHHWYNLGIANTIAYKVCMEECNSKKQKNYFIKLFNKNFYAKAKDEELLYREAQMDTFVLNFIDSIYVNDFLCHIFEYDDYDSVTQKEFQEKRFEIFEKINEYDLNSDFITKYRLQHQLIHERFSKEKIMHLENIAFTNGKKEIFVWFDNNFEKIKQDIETLPLRLVTPMMTKNTLVKNYEDEVKLLSFFNWSMEPLGFNFMSVPEKKILESITTVDEYKTALIVQHLRICERDYNSNNFVDVLQGLQQIKDLYE